MDAKKLNLSLPPVLPHGWKKEVAKTLGVHPNTVRNNLIAGTGDGYEKILKTCKEKYGKPIE